jgi:AcrR family transcriptional regulator
MRELTRPWKTWPARPESGTLYRRFPTREHLFAAILQDRVDGLDTSARRALDAPDVWRALSEWLELYDRCATEYPGMSARVGELLSDTSAVGTLCGPMRNSFGRLFERAQKEVPLRQDMTSTQLLSMVSALPKDARTGRTIEPYLRVVLDGLRG